MLCSPELPKLKFHFKVGFWAEFRVPGSDPDFIGKKSKWKTIQSNSTNTREISSFRLRIFGVSLSSQQCFWILRWNQKYNQDSTSNLEILSSSDKEPGIFHIWNLKIPSWSSELRISMFFFRLENVSKIKMELGKIPLNLEFRQKLREQLQKRHLKGRHDLLNILVNDLNDESAVLNLNPNL